MDTRQQEIYQDYLKKNPGITKSQKRHLRRVSKRKARTEKRREKQLREQAEAEKKGRLIEENHNGGLYSVEFTKKAEEYYLRLMYSKYLELQYQEDFYQKWLLFFREIRQKLQTLVLKWSDDYPRNNSFFLVVDLLDLYRENKEDGRGLSEYFYDVLSSRKSPKTF